MYPESKYARVCDTVVLLVDIKDGPGVEDNNASFAATHDVLEQYQSARRALSENMRCPWTIFCCTACWAQCILVVEWDGNWRVIVMPAVRIHCLSCSIVGGVATAAWTH